MAKRKSTKEQTTIYKTYMWLIRFIPVYFSNHIYPSVNVFHLLIWYLNFAGPRICLGKQLAEAEVILFFTSILQRFDLKKANEKDDLPTTGVHTGATLQPQPFKVCFKQRTWENIWFSKCVFDKGLERTFDFQSVF